MLLAVLVGATVGCSFDYSDAQVEGENSSEVATIELNAVTMVLIRDNTIKLTADRVATFSGDGTQRMDGLKFREYGPTGDLRIEGEAETAVLYIESEDVELSGEVIVYSTSEETLLSSQFLRWESEPRTLSGTDSGVVTIEQSDGSAIRGKGMVVDGRRNSVRFDSEVEGVYATGAHDE